MAEGNPLFIEQLLAAAFEGQADALPDSIQTLLAARLDRLGERDRFVAQAAAICGTSFSADDVATLVNDDPSASLLTLFRRELIRPGEAGDDGGEGWSFRHSVIRDVAYGSLPKWRRAELHERLAERAIERGGDVDVSAGLHLYEAVLARREVGERGAAVDGLAARAADHLGRAGVAAFDREDVAAAASLLGRANALHPREAAARIELLPKLATALAYRGDVPAGQELFAEAYTLAVELGDVRLSARATLAADFALLWTDAAMPVEQVFRDIEDAVPVLQEAADYEGLALAEALRFHALDRAGSSGVVAQFPLVLTYARRANARHLELHVTTINKLRALNDIGAHPKTHRTGPDEFRVFQVRARMVEATIEDDGDIHLVIRNNQFRKMIVELTDPTCAFTPGSIKVDEMTAARHGTASR